MFSLLVCLRLPIPPQETALEALAKGSARPAAFKPELSRAARTRLGRYGFTDVMHGGMPGAVVTPGEEQDVVVRADFHRDSRRIYVDVHVRDVI